MNPNVPTDPVSSEDSLYHKTYPQNKYVFPDGRPTFRAFKPRPKDNGELSCDVVSMTTPLLAVTENHRYNVGEWILFQIPVEKVLHYGAKARHDPLVGNAAHALIYDYGADMDAMAADLAKSASQVPITAPTSNVE